jgi:DNA-binding GntR family transcriptional regulator
MGKRHELPSERVANDLRAKIKAGDYAPGEALPSIAKLAESYEVSESAASRALGMLRDEGLIFTRHRWGSFVAE